MFQFPTRSNTNHPVQPKMICTCRGLRLQILEKNFFFLLIKNENKGANQLGGITLQLISVIGVRNNLLVQPQNENAALGNLPPPEQSGSNREPGT